MCVCVVFPAIFVRTKKQKFINIKQKWSRNLQSHYDLNDVMNWITSKWPSLDRILYFEMAFQWMNNVSYSIARFSSPCSWSIQFSCSFFGWRNIWPLFSFIECAYIQLWPHVFQLFGEIDREYFQFHMPRIKFHPTLTSIHFRKTNWNFSIVLYAIRPSQPLSLSLSLSIGPHSAYLQSNISWDFTSSQVFNLTASVYRV